MFVNSQKIDKQLKQLFGIEVAADKNVKSQDDIGENFRLHWMNPSSKVGNLAIHIPTRCGQRPLNKSNWNFQPALS